jgi:hypothetical protein
MGLVVGLVLIVYVVIVCVPALVALRRHPAPRGTNHSRAATVGASLGGIALHAGVQIAKPLAEGQLYPAAWAIDAWLGLPTFLVAALAALFFFFGRRESSPIEIGLGRGLCVALLSFTVLPLLEWPLVEASGVRFSSS